MYTLAVSCAFLWAVSSILQKYILRRSGHVLGIQLVVSGVFFAGTIVLKLLRDGDLTVDMGARELTAAVASGLFGFVLAYYLLLRLLRDYSAHESIALSYTTPAFVAVLAIFALGEEVRRRTAAGIAMIVGGAFLL